MNATSEILALGEIILVLDVRIAEDKIRDLNRQLAAAQSELETATERLENFRLFGHVDGPGRICETCGKEADAEPGCCSECLEAFEENPVTGKPEPVAPLTRDEAANAELRRRLIRWACPEDIAEVEAGIARMGWSAVGGPSFERAIGRDLAACAERVKRTVWADFKDEGIRC